MAALDASTEELNQNPYFRPSSLGPACSTERTARLRERRVAMSYEKREETQEMRALAAHFSEDELKTTKTQKIFKEFK